MIDSDAQVRKILRNIYLGFIAFILSFLLYLMLPAWLTRHFLGPGKKFPENKERILNRIDSLKQNGLYPEFLGQELESEFNVVYSRLNFDDLDLGVGDEAWIYNQRERGNGYFLMYCRKGFGKFNCSMAYEKNKNKWTNIESE